MEVIIIAWVFYLAIRQAHESAKAAFKSSREAYAARAAKAHPGMPRRRQVASALRHDLGFAAAQLRHGFPSARHGFAAGWHEARTAHAQAHAGRERAKTERAESLAGLIEEIRQYRERQAAAAERARTAAAGGTSEGSGEGTPEGGTSPGLGAVIQGTAEDVPSPGEVPDSGRYLLTVRSKSGRVLNPITSSPVETIAVWSREDLERRLAAAAGDPDLEVEHRPMPDDDWDAPLPGEDEHYEDRDAGERPGADEDQQDQAQQSTSPQNTGGTQMSDTTYDGVVRDMGTAVSTAEQHAAETNAAMASAESHAQAAADAKAQALRISEDMQALDVDPDTLGAMADHLDAADAAEKAHQAAYEAVQAARAADIRVMETAQNADATLKRGHAGLAAAHQEAPVQAAAREFYQD